MRIVKRTGPVVIDEEDPLVQRMNEWSDQWITRSKELAEQPTEES